MYDFMEELKKGRPDQQETIIALRNYLDGTDPELVGAGARTLDRSSYLNNQISIEDFKDTLTKTNEQIINERDFYNTHSIITGI